MVPPILYLLQGIRSLINHKRANVPVQAVYPKWVSGLEVTVSSQKKEKKKFESPSGKKKKKKKKKLS